MFISAHPDDIEAMAGGLVATLTTTFALNVTVVYVIVTNGDKGCTDSQFYNCSALTSADIAQIRAVEAKAAAAVLGVHTVELLNYEDGMVLSYPEQTIQEDLTVCVRRHRPAVVFTWHPEWQLDLQPGEGWDDLGYHPDHQAVGELAIATTQGPSAGDPYFFPTLLLAGLEPYGVSQIYLFTFQGYSHYVNITQLGIINGKIDSLLAHRTQYPDPDPLSASIKELGMRGAQMAGVSGEGVAYAELFYRICMNPNCAIAQGARGSVRRKFGVPRV